MHASFTTTKNETEVLQKYVRNKTLMQCVSKSMCCLTGSFFFEPGCSSQSNMVNSIQHQKVLRKTHALVVNTDLGNTIPSRLRYFKNSGDGARLIVLVLRTTIEVPGALHLTTIPVPNSDTTSSNSRNRIRNPVTWYTHFCLSWTYVLIRGLPLGKLEIFE